MKRCITGFFLVLLAANPFCCCLALDTAVHSENPAARSCCHEQLSAPANESEPCDCETFQQRDATLSEGVFSAGKFTGKLLAVAEWDACGAFAVPDLHPERARPFIDSGPPPRFGRITLHQFCTLLI